MKIFKHVSIKMYNVVIGNGFKRDKVSVFLKEVQRISVVFFLYFCFEIEFLMVYGWLYLIIMLNNRITAKGFFFVVSF